MCCRTLYSHLGGVLKVKKGRNALLAMKHGFAYALCCTPRRPQCSYIKRRPCRLLYWEGKQRVELFGIIFSRDDFSKQHQKLSFWGFGVAEEERMGDKIDEWQIDGFHSSTEEKNKKDAHMFFFCVVVLRVWESYLWRMRTLAMAFLCKSYDISSSSDGCCIISNRFRSRGKWLSLGNYLNINILIYMQIWSACL